MTIGKSILITTLILIISTLIGTLILLGFKDLPNYQVFAGLYEIIPNLATYSLVLFYFSFSKYSFSIKGKTIKRKNGILILTLIILIIGNKLIDLPFSEWEKLSNKYLGSLFILTDDSVYKFKTVQLYRAFDAIIIAPLFEEIIFRYYLFGGLLKRYNLSTALIVSSILFSLIHIGNPRELIPTFVFGLSCSKIYYFTKRIQFPIILHSMFNILWFLGILFAKDFDKMLSAVGFGGLFWTLFFIGIFLLFFGIKKMATYETQ